MNQFRYYFLHMHRWGVYIKADNSIFPLSRYSIFYSSYLCPSLVFIYYRSFAQIYSFSFNFPLYHYLSSFFLQSFKVIKHYTVYTQAFAYAVRYLFTNFLYISYYLFFSLFLIFPELCHPFPLKKVLLLVTPTREVGFPNIWSPGCRPTWIRFTRLTPALSPTDRIIVLTICDKYINQYSTLVSITYCIISEWNWPV